MAGADEKGGLSSPVPDTKVLHDVFRHDPAWDPEGPFDDPDLDPVTELEYLEVIAFVMAFFTCLWST